VLNVKHVKLLENISVAVFLVCFRFGQCKT